MTTSADLYVDWTRRVAICAAAVANYADHAEHNEPVDQRWVLEAAHDLRGIAEEIADAEDLDLVEVYAERLAAIEERSALGPDNAVGAESARAAETWRDLQLVQVEHDRVFHADVVGLMKSQQLQHYALHLTTITGALARRSVRDAVADEILGRRLPDMVLFALKLHTVMNIRLAPTSLPRTAARRRPESTHAGQLTQVARQRSTC